LIAQARDVTTGAIGAGRYNGVFLVLAVVLALVTVPLSGGRIGRLAEVRLRAAPLLFAALALQIFVLFVVPGWNDTLLRAVHLGTYGMLFTFLWVNRRMPGIWIVAVGGTLNLIAIAANAGVMPAGPAALRSAGSVSNADTFINSGLLDHPRVLFLGDVWAIPRGWPLANVFSIGDVVIAIGVFAVVHFACGSRGAPARSDADAREVAEPSVGTPTF
jgi:hypothetical protein